MAFDLLFVKHNSFKQKLVLQNIFKIQISPPYTKFIFFSKKVSFFSFYFITFLFVKLVFI